jgi:hypothetical protein
MYAIHMAVRIIKKFRASTKRETVILIRPNDAMHCYVGYWCALVVIYVT